ncbi:MAG: hypothetical protein ACI81T_001871 [Bacteroidia bacterium]
MVFSIAFTGKSGLNEIRTKAFQEKYKVEFEYLGWWNSKDEDVNGYNNTTLEYLVSTWGNVVKKEFEDMYE